MDSSNAYIYGTQSAPVEQVNLSTGTATYLIGDALGSIRGITSSSGNLAATTSYDAWGNPETAGGLTGYTPFGYAGGFTDPTGLIYLVHRYYDPQTGQFISVDPDVSQTGEPYSYANSDPVSEADPLGEWAIGVPCGDCLFSEAEFQAVLTTFLWAAAAAMGGVRVFAQPLDAMRTPLTNQLRYPDIYWLKTGKWGWINELKVGEQGWSGRNPIEVTGDAEMLKLGFAFGVGPFFRNHVLPINEDIWWFAPNQYGEWGANDTLMHALMIRGINIIEIANVPGAAPWPRKQSKKQKEEEAQELESGDGNDALRGVEGMFPSFQGCLPPP